jgi:hypothetical protein
MALRRTRTLLAVALTVLASPAPALGRDGPIGAGGTASGDQTGCAPGACTYVALGSLAGRAPANGTLTSFTLGHGSVSTATTATLDVFAQSGSTITLVRQSAPQSLQAGPAGTTAFDLSSAPLQISAGQIIGVTLVPTSGYAPSAVRAAGNSSNSSRTCEGTPMVGQPFSCASIDIDASTVALSALFLSDIRPPGITPQPVSAVGPFGATVNASIDPNGAATTATVSYGTSASDLSLHAPVLNMGSSDGDVPYSQTLTNLAPGTTYYYAVSATNETDTTTMDPPASFTTDPAPPPAISENPSPAMLTSSAATIGAQIDPQGTATDFKVLYGTANPPSGQSESAATRLSGHAVQTYQQALSGLASDTTYFWEVAAYRGGVQVAASPVHQFTTSHQPDPGSSSPPGDGSPPPGGGSPGTDTPVYTAPEIPVFTAETLPPPVLGVSANAETEKGTVLIKLPPGTSAAKADALGLRGAASDFVPLDKARQIPLRSTLDTTDGTVKLITAGDSVRPLQPGHFRGGQFIVQQTKKSPLTTLSMVGGGLSSCTQRVPNGGSPKPAAAARSHRRVLHSSVLGHFASRGRNSVATVRGTEWTMTDTCTGTLTQVKTGTVEVRDLTLRKNVVLHRGDSYLARAPLRKRRQRR